MARVVVPGIPHHVMQRGVRRMDVFFSDADRGESLRLMAQQAARYGVTFLAWWLMHNHVHLIVVPKEETSLARGIGEAHRRDTRYINFREGWRGFLFQGRFHSAPLDGKYMLAAVRYVLRNPVRAEIVKDPWAYRWSSARSFVDEGTTDALSVPTDLLDGIPNRRAFLLSEDEGLRAIRRNTRTGRSLGSEPFVDELEARTGRTLRPGRPDPKPRS